MFNNISWASYGYALSISVIIYYAIVLSVWYRQELQFYCQNFLKPGKAESAAAMESRGGELDKDQTSWQDVEELPVRSIVDDLSVLIQRGAEQDYLKAELLQALKVRLNSSQDGIGHKYKPIINNRIIADCKRYCSMHLDEEELEVLWFD